MKVILLNGSPHADVCTYTALQETVRGLKDYGVDTEILHIGKDSIPGCKGCLWRPFDVQAMWMHRVGKAGRHDICT